MLNTIKTHVFLPLMQRIGTASATVLVGYGLQADLAHAVAAFVIAGGGIAYDLIAHFISVRNQRAALIREQINASLSIG